MERSSARTTKRRCGTSPRIIVLLVISVFTVLVCADPALANDGAPLLGKWTEKLSHGGQMLVEFTETSMSFTPVDAAGGHPKPANTAQVTFKNLGKSEGSESVAIDIKDPKGGPSSGILAIIKSRDELVLDFPGLGAHVLKRSNDR